MSEGPDFEPSRPFNYVWWLASTDDPEGMAEKTWWRENFIDNANLIVDKTSVQAFIAGDAPVANRGEHFGSLSQGERGSEMTGSPAPGIGGGGGGGGPPRLTGGGGGKGQGKPKDRGGPPIKKQPWQQVKDKSRFLTDGNGTDICGMFNSGKCASQGNSTKCPKGNRTHICCKCGKAGHAVTDCSSNGGGNSGYNWQPNGGGKSAKRKRKQ